MEDFSKVINRARLVCKNIEFYIEEHFPDLKKTIKIPKNITKEVVDYEFSKYACYLIVQNGV